MQVISSQVLSFRRQIYISSYITVPNSCFSPENSFCPHTDPPLTFRTYIDISLKFDSARRTHTSAWP